MAQDGSLHNTSAGTPTAWYQAISTIYGQSANTATSGGMEIDFTEMTGGVYTGAILDWTTTVGGGIGTSNGYSATGAAVPQVYNAQHSYAVNWVLSTQNGGTGLIQFMIDGILFKTLSYSSGAGSSPASTPSNPNGVYFGAESKTYAFLLDGGYHWPMVVSRVRALCKPGLNC
jgi:hypothetical protein